MASEDTNSDSDDRLDESVDYETDPWTAQGIVEDHDAYPAHDSQTEGEGDEGLLRIGFRDDEEDFKQVSWEEFREEFEEKELALLYSTDDSPVEGDRPLTLLKRDDIDD